MLPACSIDPDRESIGYEVTWTRLWRFWTSSGVGYSRPVPQGVGPRVQKGRKSLNVSFFLDRSKRIHQRLSSFHRQICLSSNMDQTPAGPIPTGPDRPLRARVNVKAYSQFPARTSSRTQRNTERGSMSERSAHKGLCSTCSASPLILTGSSYTCSGFF